jgi:hypothetical protein
MAARRSTSTRSGDYLVNALYTVCKNAHEKHHSEPLQPFGLDARDPAFRGQGFR